MKKIKYGKLPVNAAISIDYTKKEPKIKFRYPRKDVISQNRGIIALPLIMIFSLFWIFPLSYGVDILGNNKIYPENCEFIEGYKDNFIINITFVCDNGVDKTVILSKRPFKSNYVHYAFQMFKSGDFLSDNTLKNKEKILSSMSLVGFFTFFVLILPFLLEIPLLKLAVKNEWFKEKIPKINDKIRRGNGYEVVFKKVPDNLYVEVPLFRNVRLDYYATKDFSKYIKKVEIEPHPFNKISHKKGRKNKISHKKGRKKKKKNISLWYARFYFKEKPKTGKLEVVFK